MQKKYFILLASLYFLGINSVYAEETKQSENSQKQVEDIIAKIQKAKDEPNEPRDRRISVPTVPTVPEPIQVSKPLVDDEGHILYKALEEIRPPRKKPFFTNRVAPERFKKGNEVKSKEFLPGDIQNARVTAYLHAPMMDVNLVKQKLEEAGFEVISKFKVDKKGKVTSLVFTNDAMKKAAAQNIRGFASSLRVVVDEKNKLVNIPNPIYHMKAFMQEQYNSVLGEETLQQLRTVFPNLKPSVEIVKFQALERFRFMENMPYYQDMKVIKKGKNDDLLAIAKKSKKVVYDYKLANGSILLGVELGRRTSKFVKKIGYENSGLLPYPVLIENGEAKILAPQYYIAVMYPLLKMSKFMTIATVPGAITKDIDKIFR